MYTTPQSKQESDSHLAMTAWSSDRGLLQEEVCASVKRRRPMSGQDNIHSASFLTYADSSSGRDGVLLGGEDRDIPLRKQKVHHSTTRAYGRSHRSRSGYGRRSRKALKLF